MIKKRVFFDIYNDFFLFFFSFYFLIDNSPNSENIPEQASIIVPIDFNITDDEESKEFEEKSLLDKVNDLLENKKQQESILKMKEEEDRQRLINEETFKRKEMRKMKAKQRSHEKRKEKGFVKLFNFIMYLKI
jgi:FKBP-type peptidyl-prolyl cis-trans isomerase